MSESVVLCEGYHDRAFWAGWLQHLGCTDPGLPSGGKTSRSAILDPWNTPVSGGQYAYHSKSGQFVRVVPCNGKNNILDVTRLRLKERTSKPLVRLVTNVDPDIATGSTTATGLRRMDVEQVARTFDPAAAPNSDGEIEMDGGATSSR